MPTFPSRAIQHVATSPPGIWLTNRVYGAHVRRQLRRALTDPHGQQ